MAIAELGVEVAICVGNKPLTEYDYSQDSEAQLIPTGEDKLSNTIIKYIEAITGQNFKINLEILDSYKAGPQALSFLVYIDGEFVRAMALRRDDNDFRHQGSIDGIKMNQDDPTNCIKKMFQFGEIELTDDLLLPQVERNVEALRYIGEIKIEVFRVTIGEVTEPHAGSSQLRNLGKVHEEAIKGRATSHVTSLGNGLPAVPSQFYDTEYLDQLPIITFQFLYRSRESLKSLLLIKRTPEAELPDQAPLAQEQSLSNQNIPAGVPAPPHSSRSEDVSVIPDSDIDNLSEAQLEARMAQIAARLAARRSKGWGYASPGATIKTEPGDTDGELIDFNIGSVGDGRQATIKREDVDAEMPARPAKRRRFMGKVTIDLTENEEPQYLILD